MDQIQRKYNRYIQYITCGDLEKFHSSVDSEVDYLIFLPYAIKHGHVNICEYLISRIGIEESDEFFNRYIKKSQITNLINPSRRTKIFSTKILLDLVRGVSKESVLYRYKEHIIEIGTHLCWMRHYTDQYIEFIRMSDFPKRHIDYCINSKDSNHKNKFKNCLIPLLREDALNHLID